MCPFISSNVLSASVTGFDLTSSFLLGSPCGSGVGVAVGATVGTGVRLTPPPPPYDGLTVGVGVAVGATSSVALASFAGYAAKSYIYLPSANSFHAIRPLNPCSVANELSVGSNPSNSAFDQYIRPSIKSFSFLTTVSGSTPTDARPAIAIQPPTAKRDTSSSTNARNAARSIATAPPTRLRSSPMT